MIAVYQFNLNSSEVDEINSKDCSQEVTDLYRAYLEQSVKANVQPGLNLKRYKLVCEVDTNDLEKAFEYTNIGPEEKLVRKSRMHSGSVGDIFVKDGKPYVCASVGFEPLDEQVFKSGIDS